MDVQQIVFYVSLAILVGTGLLEWLKKPLLAKHASRIYLYTVCTGFAYLITIGYLQFVAFSGGVLRTIIGTPQGIKWFFSYIALHFWNQYLVSFVGGLIFFFVARYFNNRFAERFFWREELYLASLSIFLIGYPGWFFYIILLLIVAVVGALATIKRKERLPLYHLWIPIAIATHLIIGFWASHQAFWSAFKF